MITDIIDWRNQAQIRDFYAFDFDIAHKEVMGIVNGINEFYESIGSNLRVRKSWKAIEACEVGEE